ncbi:MAG: hypothetical protein Q4E55_03165 [Bacteroidales bacterium]|nr:hypothetical protein [Bacteroidales bacterium]
MKSLNILLVSFLACLCVACDQDNKGSIYQADNINASFTFSELELSAPASSPIINVPIYRGITNEAATVNVTSKVAVQGISVPTSVTFQAGESVAYLPISLGSSVEPGQSVSIELTLDASAIGEGCIGTTTVLASLTLEWEDGGSCTFIDYTFSDGASAKGVKIEHGKGTNMYRIVQPWIAVYGYGPDGFVNDTGVQFIFNPADNSIQWKMSSSGVVADLDKGTYTFVWPSQYADRFVLANEGNDYYTSMFGLVEGDGYYSGFSFEFIWDEGWPGK